MMKYLINESQYELLLNEYSNRRVKYSKEILKQIASEYKTKKEFERANQGAYQAAIKYGPCYDLTTNEEVPCKKYDKEKNFIVPTPNSKNTFGFLESITSHMTSGSDYGNKLVYSFKFYDDDDNIVGVYVGITNDEERRKKEHIIGRSKFGDKEVKSAVNKFVEENPNFRVEFEKLSDHTDFPTAKELEKKFVEQYREKGYKILNIAKTGGGGRTFLMDDYFIQKAQDWVKMKLDRGEVPYVSDYDKFDHSNYSSIRRRNLTDLAFKGMVYMDRTKYSDDDIFKAVMSSDSYSDFYKKYKYTAYQLANRRGLLPKIKSMFDERPS